MAKTYRITRVENDTFDEASPDVRKMIVEYGCSVFKSISHKSLVYNGDVQEYKEKLREEFEKSLQQHININNERKERIEEISVLNKLLQEQNESLKNKYECNNTKKGQLGEQSIQDYIEKNFTDCEIENTAKTTAAGDLKLSIESLNILLESKNKVNITKDDLKKFERDVRETNSNAGIFICIKDITIPCRGAMNFEIIDNRPLVYMTNFENMPEILKLCVQLCISLCKKCELTPTELENKLSIFVEGVNSMLPVMKTCKTHQEKALKDIKSIISNFEDQLIKLI